MKISEQFNKLGLYMVSLIMLFVFVLILSAKVPFCFGSGCSFIGFKTLISSNIVPLICIALILLGVYFFIRFKNITKYNGLDSVKITECQSESYENLTFLATYIVPFIGFSFDDPQKNLAYFLLIIVIGLIFIKTDKYYANPTRALFGYKLYKVSITHASNGETKNLIAITTDNLVVGDYVYYSFFDELFFIARKNNELSGFKK
ncbi:anti-phage protein KwaA [Enterobacter roggenkampii]